ncbi:MAG: hypothetical protein AAGH64_00140 [Planctomycetota bacterium]
MFQAQENFAADLEIVIAHSHGGNVAAKAMRSLGTRRSGSAMLVSMGTPYFEILCSSSAKKWCFMAFGGLAGIFIVYGYIYLAATAFGDLEGPAQWVISLVGFILFFSPAALAKTFGNFHKMCESLIINSNSDRALTCRVDAYVDARDEAIIGTSVARLLGGTFGFVKILACLLAGIFLLIPLVYLPWQVIFGAHSENELINALPILAPALAGVLLAVGWIFLQATLSLVLAPIRFLVFGPELIFMELFVRPIISDIPPNATHAAKVPVRVGEFSATRRSGLIHCGLYKDDGVIDTVISRCTRWMTSDK